MENNNSQELFKKNIKRIIELENEENSVVRLVLIDEKLGLMKVDSDERPGPLNILG